MEEEHGNLLLFERQWGSPGKVGADLQTQEPRPMPGWDSVAG